MSSSSVRPGQEFQCPLCMVINRATAKFCRKCGNPRALLKHTSPSDGDDNKALASSNANDESAFTMATEEILPVEHTGSDAPSNPAGKQELPVIQVCAGCLSHIRYSDCFCCWCGASQPTRASRQFKLCDKCSQSLPTSANFCFECGHGAKIAGKLHMRVPEELFSEESSEFFPTFEV